ncbi:DNA ligase 4 [Phanerochaete sordida]|uniref:DNA ligase n=1 Tax=Phanerochaete sordida TaxID=48140 RepID=A0A9P3GBS8_9APHY|nr:DNA ligase 4 [Phanerochaete sordida]
MQQPSPAPTDRRASPPISESTAAAEDHPVEYPAPPQNEGSAPFYVLSALFDRLQNERKPDKRRRLLATWFNHWREEKGYDLYPVLRLILPQKDRERAVYGLKEKAIAKTYIRLIPLQKGDHDAIRLLNWKKPTEKDASVGDFPTVLYEVIAKRSSVIHGTLSVEDVNDVLDELAKSGGKSDQQVKIMTRVYNSMTAEEQRWLVRIILKDMVISVRENTVFSVFHPDAHDLFNTCSDLKKVAWELWDPERRLNDEEKTVSLFRAFAPMLCKRPTKNIEESIKDMGGSKFIIEEKLDGERMQLHKRGNEYFYCSRKGKDYTYLYGKHIGTGSLTPFINDAFDPRVEEIILDGEMLVWDPISERNLPFGTLKTAAGDKSNKNVRPRPCFKVFDLLYLNGQSLLQRSTRFRKRNLRSCLSEVKGRLEFVSEYEGKTAQDVRLRMEEIMNNRGEGLIMKHPDSEYVLNGRNKDWIKVKPEYIDNMGETVDVLVVAGNYGTGRRSGGVSTLICAVLDDQRAGDDDDEPRYRTFVRIGTGLTFADYIWIRQKPWKEWDPKSPPPWLLTSKRGQDDKGDIYLEPEDSFILKVKAAEITPTDQYHMGYTMRFPRALMIRDDLGVEDCMTASSLFETMRHEKKRKSESGDSVTKKKRKTTAKKAAVLPQYNVAKDLKEVQKMSELFKELTFLVSSDPKSRTGEAERKELMKLQVDPTADACVGQQTMAVYDGATVPYDIKMIMDRGAHDIVKPAWIRDSVERGELAPLTKRYLFFATDDRKDSEAYKLEEDADIEMEEPAVDEVAPPSPAPSSETEPEAEDAQANEPADPALADWFKVDAQKGKAPARDEDIAESETEPESDNDDVRDDDVEIDELADELGDDWSQVLMPDKDEPDDSAQATGSVKMGETDEAMEYDQDLIFKHLCFYLDSPTNAAANGMTVKAKNPNDLDVQFNELVRKIKANGGRITDSLDEPKLTHILLDKRDTSRRVELGKRTSKPKRKHLVLTDFIEACLEEDTLLDEDSFGP